MKFNKHGFYLPKDVLEFRQDNNRLNKLKIGIESSIFAHHLIRIRIIILEQNTMKVQTCVQ